MSKLRGQLDKVRNEGCHCDVMHGYTCEIHELLEQLETIIEDRLRLGREATRAECAKAVYARYDTLPPGPAKFEVMTANNVIRALSTDADRSALEAVVEQAVKAARLKSRIMGIDDGRDMAAETIKDLRAKLQQAERGNIAELETLLSVHKMAIERTGELEDRIRELEQQSKERVAGAYERCEKWYKHRSNIEQCPFAAWAAEERSK